jgi:serine/threonine protein kinase
MNEEFAALSGLLDRALDIQVSERERWLDDLPEPLPGLKLRLRELLAGEKSGELAGFLTKSPLLIANDARAADQASRAGFQPGSVIANYKLVRELGQGGMSTVWLALRTDQLIDRPVALKLPFMHLQSARFADRFARERDILARLTHPNIAHLYDAGVSAEGQPYLAMEFVSGEPLTQYCNDRRLEVTERLRLFLQVLLAVQYAHAHSIIHRDLKPSNILVREGDQVVLLDFGIAKLLVDGEQDESDFTRHGGLALTPDFASPEQICGEPLGPASDIYSLGVILYELLSGQRPYALKGTSRRALEEAILSADPCPPSNFVGKSIRGDMDAIVLMAMKKKAGERYADAAAFAEDLRRYMHDEPVSARADSLWYRAKKFAARHRAWLQGAAAAGLVVSLVIMVAGVLLVGHRKPFAPPTHSIAVLPFANMSGDPNQDYLSDGISEELLDALTHVTGLQVAARNSSFSFKGKNIEISAIAQRLNVASIVEGSVRRDGNTVRITAKLIDATTGYNLWSQSFDRSSTDLLKVQSEVATAVAQRLDVNLIGDEAAKLALGGTTNAAAYDAYLHGMQLYYQPNTGEAGYRAAAAAFTNAVDLDPRFALAYTRQAAALLRVYMVGSDAGARPALRAQARAAAERAVALAPQLGEAHLAVAISHDIGVEDRSEAAREYERALALAPGSAWVQLNYGLFSSTSGRFDAAVTAARRAVTLDPQNVDTRDALAFILTAGRRHSEALVVLQEAKALRPDSHYIEFYIVDNLLASGQIEAARQECELPAAPLDADGRHDCLAFAYHALGRYEDAVRELEQFQTQDGDSAAYRYARIYAQWGDKAAAFKWLDTAERLQDPDLSLLKVDWQFDPIRGQPQFKAVEARMHIQP